MLLLKICFWRRAQAVERRRAFDGRKISLKRVFYHERTVHREARVAAHNQAATVVVNQTQSYLLKTDTTKKMSSMNVRVVARRKKRDTGLHDLLGG